MVGGIDVIIYQPDEELKKLDKLSIDLGVDETVMTAVLVDQILKALDGSGKRKKNGWRPSTPRESRGSMFQQDRVVPPDASWNDDLEVPVSAMRIYIEKLGPAKT